MPALTSVLLGVGIAASAYGTYQTYQGTKEATAAKKQESALRERSMTLDAARRRREVVRQMIATNAQNTALATAAGTSTSSALSGAGGSVMGQASTNILGISQNEQIGNDIFAANRRGFAGATEASIGEGMQSLGGAIVRNRESISRVGGYFAGGKTNLW